MSKLFMFNKFKIVDGSNLPLSVLLFTLSPLFIVVSLVGCGSSKEEQPVFTQVNEILADTQHVCKDDLIAVANDLILSKEHFLQLDPVPAFNIDAEEQDNNKALNEESTLHSLSQDSVESPKQPSTEPLTLSGALLYKDRPSHVRFNATVFSDKDTGKQQCLVGYQLDYHFNVSCIDVREEAFKKWIHLSQLNENTRYYVHKRKPNLTVYLTSLNRNTQCLASVRSRENFFID